MKNFRTNATQSGFTLIELMIAMLIGVFLMAGVIQIFLSAKQAYRLQENLSRLQENGRFAMDILTKDIRMAGFSGCASKVPPTNIVDPAYKTLPNINTMINGIDNATNPSTCYQCLLGTDMISIQSAGSCGGQVREVGNATDPASFKISKPNDCDIGQNDVVIVANCSASTAFVNVNASDGNVSFQTLTHGIAGKNQKSTDVTGCPNPTLKLCNQFGTDSEIYMSKSISYFIRTGEGGLPSLFRINSSKASPVAEELIEGIENMQILYGVDTDPTPDFVPNYYVDASKIPATILTKVKNETTGAITDTNPSGWTRVVSIRINLLAVTIDNNLTDAPQPYFYDGTTITQANLSASGSKPIAVLKTDTSQLCPSYTTLPSTCQLVDDRRIHRVFSSTIAVRNRLP